ncbi:MAG: hypothetical protein ACLU37_09395 [Collinsella sp.]
MALVCPSTPRSWPRRSPHARARAAGADLKTVDTSNVRRRRQRRQPIATLGLWYGRRKPQGRHL